MSLVTRTTDPTSETRLAECTSLDTSQVSLLVLQLARTDWHVAAFPIPEVIRGINAFTLGVRSVNPDATVEVVDKHLV